MGTSTTGSSTRRPPGEGRSFEERYGAAIASRGIATFPTLILRWQGALDLTNGELVTLGHVLSFYREGGKWPSVSIDAIAKARDIHRSIVEREFAGLAAKGYVARAGTDARFRTFHYDVSGLLSKLGELVHVEEELARLRVEIARIRRLGGTKRTKPTETTTEDEIENVTQTTSEHKGPRGRTQTGGREAKTEFDSSLPLPLAGSATPNQATATEALR